MQSVAMRRSGVDDTPATMQSVAMRRSGVDDTPATMRGGVDD
jgi:hypothetical protein